MSDLVQESTITLLATIMLIHKEIIAYDAKDHLSILTFRGKN